MYARLKLSDIDKILDNCGIIANNENIEEKEAEESHNSVCPSCHARKKDIVNKFGFVESKGGVTGKVNFGHGEVSSNFLITTSEVNHCNNCGNEWRKYIMKDVAKEEILKVALKYLSEVLHDYDNQKTYAWKLDTIEVFKESYHETLSSLFKKYGKYVSKIPSRKLLAKHYKSVYDIDKS